MSKRWIKRNSTSQSIDIFIPNSSSTTGAGLTGLVFNSAGLTCAQRVGNAAAVAITLATQTATGAYSSGGFAEVSSTLMPGVYRFDIPNAQLTTAGILILYFKGATNMAPVVVEIEVTEVDIYDVVRAGLTALPNVAQGNAGSLALGNATGQVTVVTNNDKTGYSLSGTQTFNVTGNITGNVTGSIGSIASGGITSTSFATDSITATAIATDAITSAELSTSAVQEIADGILSRKLNMAGNISDVSVTSISSATFTGANTFVAGDMVQFLTTAPTSFTVGTKYYVISTSLTATTFQLSATSGGSAITTVSTGAYTVVPIDDRTVRSALRYLRNKVSANTATMTICTEDDVTTSWTSSLTADASAAPITISDPA
jgi:hypothetical protein